MKNKAYIGIGGIIYGWKKEVETKDAKSTSIE